jgi:hypothetical protein
MHVIKGGRNRNGRDIGDITVRNDSGIEDNDTDVSAMQECDVKNAMYEWNR